MLVLTTHFTSSFSAASSFPFCTHCWNLPCRSGTADTSPATRATVPRCQVSTTPHSAPPACHATGGHGYQLAELRAALARRSTTVYRSTPSVLPCGVRGITQSNFRMRQFRASKVYETGSSALQTSAGARATQQSYMHGLHSAKRLSSRNPFCLMYQPCCT